jgi:hypothetical protein
MCFFFSEIYRIVSQKQIRKAVKQLEKKFFRSFIHNQTAFHNWFENVPVRSVLLLSLTLINSKAGKWSCRKLLFFTDQSLVAAEYFLLAWEHVLLID